MRIARLADILNHKYQLASYAIDNEDVKKSLKSFRDVWLDGPRVKDQSILVWADKDNKGSQFDLIRELIDKVKNLAINPGLSSIEMYTEIKRALTISKILKDSVIEEILNAIILSMKGKLRNTDLNQFRGQATKIRTFLRMLDSVYDKAKIIIGKSIPADIKADIDSESMGGYELQKPGLLSKKEVSDFVKYHPEAAKFGLDNEEILNVMLAELQLRPLVEKLIRAIKRGHSPRSGTEIMNVTDSLKELHKKLITNLSLFDSSEEDAKQQIDMPRQLEESEDRQQEWQNLTQSQQWAKQMQEFKKQKLQDQEANPSVLTKEQLQEQINQRDFEHKQKVEEKIKEEDKLISKYNNLSFEQWIRA